MLNFTIYIPFFLALFILLIPKSKWQIIRSIGLLGAVLAFAGSIFLLIGFDVDNSSLQFRTTLNWIPGINAKYDIGIDGLSLPIILLTTFLMLMVMIYVFRQKDRAKEHSFLFLLMETGLLGLFSSQDLLLFYLFFEIGLVPMYFIIGLWGHDNRRYAAMKFFLYTRAGSLAMLLSFLALYLSVDPHSFSLPEIIKAQPFAGSIQAGGFIMLGMLIGFGVKLPTFPLHNWLPDAHVEAPTEGSVMLAGVQLKMGAYGLLRVMLPVLPDVIKEYGLILILLAVISMIYAALAALAQNDLKRLIAYTSINHMAYVMLAVAVFAMTDITATRALAFNGAVYQIISHGILTGGMFFMVGILEHYSGERSMNKFGGLLQKVPVYSTILILLAFGSFGLPGFSGFIAEFQVIAATVGIKFWAAILVVIGIIITTGLYLRIIINIVWGKEPENMPPMHEPGSRDLFVVAALTAVSIFLGIFPGLLSTIIGSAANLLANIGI